MIRTAAPADVPAIATLIRALAEYEKLHYEVVLAEGALHKHLFGPRPFAEVLLVEDGGKPVGFKLCLGRPHEFIAICKAMLESGIMPDFVTVDGGEGGTGAAPLEFSNSVGTPLEEALTFVHGRWHGPGGNLVAARSPITQPRLS